MSAIGECCADRWSDVAAPAVSAVVVCAGASPVAADAAPTFVLVPPCAPAPALSACATSAGACTDGVVAGAGTPCVTGGGLAAVDSASATVRASPLYVPPPSGMLLPPTSAALACSCSAAAVTLSRLPLCRPSTAMLIAAPTVLLSASSSLSNRAPKMPP